MFWRVLTYPGDHVLSHLGTDLSHQFIHWRSFGFDEMARGVFPLWNPHIYGGTPFIAGFQSALLYPLNAVFLILPLATAVNVSIALHVFLGGVFFYLWMSKRGLHPLASFLAGAEFMFCAPHFLHIYAGHLPNLCTLIWVPLLFLAIDSIFERPILPPVLLGAFAVAMQILAGHVQYVYYTALAACIYVGLCLFGTSDRILKTVSFAGIYFGAVLLGAIQLFPGFNAFEENIRSGGLPLAEAGLFSFPVENLITWLAPGFFGDLVHFPYWGRWYLWEMSLFMGVTGFALALYGLFLSGARDRHRLAIMVVILLLLAMGSYMFWYECLYSYFPFYSTFRGTSKFILPATVFLIALSAMGLDSLIRVGIRRHRVVVATAVCAVIAGLTFGFLVYTSSSHPDGTWARLMAAMSDTRQSYLPDGFYTDPDRVRQAGEFAATGLVLFAATCFVLAVVLFIPRDNRVKASLLVAVVLAELFIAGSPGRVTFRLADVMQGPVIRFFKERPGDYRVVNTFNANMSMSHGTYDIWGYDPVVLKRYAEFLAYTQGEDPDAVTQHLTVQHYHPLFSLLRCRYVVSARGRSVGIRELPGEFMPRVSLINDWVVLGDRNSIFAFMGRREFDPRRQVVLERDPGIPEPTAARSAGLLRITESTVNHLTIEADVPQPSILLVTDAYSKGWRAFDAVGQGNQVYEVLPANYAFRGIPLTAGSHKVRMEYGPASFTIGKWISITSITILAVVLSYPLIRRLRPKCKRPRDS